MSDFPADPRALHAERLATLGTLAAGLSHEISAPLASVLTNLDVVLERLGELDAPTEQVRPLVEALIEARASVDHMGSAVSSLRRFGEVQDEELADVTLREAVDLGVAMAGHDLRHRARLSIDHQDAPPTRGSVHALAQVVVHLLSNAAQALPVGDASAHQVTVRTSRGPSGTACLEVRDTGSGIPAEALHRIFDRDYSTRVTPGRHGLGLALCRTIVEGFGGRIEATSQPGQGTTMRVLLPAVDARTPSPVLEASAPAPAPARRGRVLLVDDDPLVRAALSRALGREHDVEPVPSGRAALEHLRSDRAWDVVICDLMMPDLTGRQLYEIIEQEHPDLAARMVFVTGGAFTDETRAFLSRIDNPVFHKPFRIRVLRDVIAAAIALVG